MFKEKTTRFI